MEAGPVPPSRGAVVISREPVTIDPVERPRNSGSKIITTKCYYLRKINRRFRNESLQALLDYLRPLGAILKYIL